MAVFVTFVVLTNTVGVKLFTAFGIVLPVSIIWFPLTFLITDIVSEMYGARRARFLVIMGFCMSLLLLAFSLIGIRLPVAEFYPLQEDYTNIFGPIWRLLFGSMAAYLLAQLIDVRLFHFWKKLTKGKHLWLRNNASTMISQFIDTFTVNTIFLYKNPTIFTGDFSDLMGVILGVYILKVAIAALDTPLCYLGVWFVERMTGVKGEDIS
ncbi:queuosine precursor transporter [candidate division KSB1 bacterium]|nr:queuosine precursor transporter [candidate division KSB1 bacterium]MCH7755971.1 queuosine precursor transporter [candidate division KSB1 bacterium]